MHVLDSLMHELQTLNSQQKQAEDSITDSIIELEKDIRLTTTQS